MRRLTKLDFAERPARLALEGKKILTGRRSRKLFAGCVFFINDTPFIIDNRGRQLKAPVWYIAQYYFREEGYDSPLDYLNDIVKYYPNIRLDEFLYLHWFRPHEILNTADKKSRHFVPHLVDVIPETPNRGHYTRKRTNGPSSKQQKPDGRCKSK